MATFKEITKFGRLGNQLFQLGATYAHSKNVGEPAFLTKQYFDHFNRLFPNFKDFYQASLRPTAGTYNEPSFEYQPLPFNKNLNLHGYFQSERYFENCKEDVLKMFGRNVKPNPNLCALHLRRGDYKRYPKTYPLLGREYYVPAIQRIRQLNPNVTIKVFSDSITEARQLLNDQKLIYANGSELQDFDEMTSAAFHIIANSSFSWWAAYLSRSENVVAPKQWFVNGYANWHDIYTDKMLRI